MVSLYGLMHLGEELDDEYEDMNKHSLDAHNRGRGKGKFQGECYHFGNKGHISIGCFLKKS